MQSIVASSSSCPLKQADSRTSHPVSSNVCREPERRPRSVTISFSSLDIEIQRSRLVVGYDLDPSDWRQLETRDVSLWFNVAFAAPGRNSPPRRFTTYTVAVPKQRGEVTLPEWLTLDRVRRVGFCPIGTGPADHLGWGRGYVCHERLWLDIGRRTTRTIEMVYHTGFTAYPNEPWFVPPLTLPE